MEPILRFHGHLVAAEQNYVGSDIPPVPMGTIEDQLNRAARWHLDQIIGPGVYSAVIFNQRQPSGLVFGLPIFELSYR